MRCRVPWGVREAPGRPSARFDLPPNGALSLAKPPSPNLKKP